ncbi:hypothetical protein MNBD_CHLOROFLEXI01-4124 [hydrothermal vent metagenome]|uniref:Pectinacetylesterase n=1 Tax=hydrothermal vent metagenome TaxID=652676 RepID=A0A3B0V2V8_9ZZZZ
MEKVQRIAGRFILLIAVLIIGLTVFFYQFVLIQPTQLHDFSQTETLVWNRVDLDNDTLCSDGSEYFILTNRGSSNNLLIHFSGGGACWDVATCSEVLSLPELLLAPPQLFYFPEIFSIWPTLLGGVHQRDNLDNPFAEWNIVYIPYCTGDLHIGNAINSYQSEMNETVTVRHNGRNNTLAALDWISLNIENPDTVLISGDSAGGFASIFWTPQIVQQYPDANLYQLSDSAFLESSRWGTTLDDTWKVDWEHNFGYPSGDDIVGNAYLRNTSLYSDQVTFLQFSSLYDDVLTSFYAAFNDIPINSDDYILDWSDRMLQSVRTIDASASNYFYYLTDFGYDETTLTTPHSAMARPEFYEIEESEVFFVDWLAKIVIDGERYSVGTVFLDQE